MIRQVTEEKVGDSSIRATVLAHSDDAIYLEETYRGQINQMIRGRYGELGRYEDLVDEKYIDDGAIFDIMAITVIDHHWPSAGVASE